MTRSSWKIPRIILKLEKNISQSAPTTIYERAATITPRFIGKTVRIFNGLRSTAIKITEHHVGYKFGAFVLTKKRRRSNSKKKVKK